MYTRKLWYEHFTPAFWIHNLCEFTAREHIFKRRFCTQKPVCTFVLKISYYGKSESKIYIKIKIKLHELWNFKEKILFKVSLEFRGVTRIYLCKCKKKVHKDMLVNMLLLTSPTRSSGIANSMTLINRALVVP